MEDYRDRIREHEFTCSPEAWTAMESLMEQELPTVFPKNGKTWWRQILGNTFNVLVIGTLAISMEGNVAISQQSSTFQRPHEQVKAVVNSNSADRTVAIDITKPKSQEKTTKVKEQISKTNPVQQKNIPRQQKGGVKNEVDQSMRPSKENAEKQSTSFEMAPPVFENSSILVARDTQKLINKLSLSKNRVPVLSLLRKDSTAFQKRYGQSNLALVDSILDLTPKRITDKRKVNEIQLGAGPSKLAAFDGWQIGLESLFPIGKRLDFGAAITYKRHESPQIGPDLTGQFFLKRHTILEGDIRLYWEVFQKRRHKLRAGAGVGIQFFNNYEKITRIPFGIDILKTQRATWRASTQLMVDYRYYLNGPYHIGIQTGVQPFDENALYLKISAGFRW